MRIKNINKILIILFFVTVSSSNGQIKNSVYSMLGIGKLSDNSFGINRSLGGTGIAFRSGNSINYLNPASYLGFTADSHILEAGLYGMVTTSKTSSASEYKDDINFDYLALGFYFADWWGGSVGIAPYSYIDYQINSSDQINGELTKLNKLYEGTGGLNRIYFGNSVNVYDELSLGFNLNYIVGPVKQTETATSEDETTSYTLSHELTVGSFYLDYGLQYTLKYEDLGFTVGAIYGPNNKLDTTDELELLANGLVTPLSKDEKESLSIPEKIGFGMSVAKENLFRVGLDYERGDWSSVRFSNENLVTLNSNRYSLGIEYNPDEDRKGGWVNNLTYRFGANYKNSYLQIDNTKINSFAVNLGVSIPYDLASTINLSLEYGREGTTDNGLIRNDYFKLYGSISLHEFWQKSIGF